MQLLTFATFWLKDRVVGWFRRSDGSTNKVGLGLSVWLIMFLSKFVFLAVIDVIFGENVEISGFVGLLLMIICLTLVQKLVTIADKKLAE
jgi:hypothetical protein